MVRRAALILAAITIAQPAFAQNFRTEVDKEKASLVADADDAFMKAIREDPQEFERLGIGFGQGRAITLWLTLVVPLGFCHRDGGEVTLPIWLSASDGFGDMGKSFRKVGLDDYEQLKAEDPLGKANPQKRAAFCKPRIAAVRELLAERFGVR